MKIPNALSLDIVEEKQNEKAILSNNKSCQNPFNLTEIEQEKASNNLENMQISKYYHSRKIAAHHAWPTITTEV